MKVLLICIFSIPLLLIGAYSLFIGMPYTHINRYNHSDWISAIGTIFSYFGLAFSFFAALKVNEISSKYYAKIRLPRLSRDLKIITSDMTKNSNKKPREIMSEKFFSQIPVALKSIQRIKGHSMKKTVADANKKYKKLYDCVNGNQSSNNDIGEFDQYWEMVAAISMTHQEIEVHLKEQEAL